MVYLYRRYYSAYFVRYLKTAGTCLRRKYNYVHRIDGQRNISNI